jgi:predicted transcriptional regulator
VKVKNVKLGVRSLDTAFADWAETFEKARRGKRVGKSQGIYFTSLEAMRKVLTEKRLELLHVIKERQPDSVYELSRLVKRDLKNVNQDLTVLKNIGLVSISRDRKGREKVIPRVNYDKIQLEIGV